VPGAVALWLVLEWYGSTSQVPWLFLLGAWVFAMIVAAAAYAAWNRRGLRLHLAVGRSLAAEDSPLDDLPEQLLRTAPGTPLFEGDGVAVELGLNADGASRGPAWISGEIADRKVTLGTGVVPRSGWRKTIDVEQLRRGALGATGWSIGTSDPLGFFAGRRECGDKEVALVLPRFRSMSNRRLVRELVAAAAAPRAGSGNELFGIREYRPGDSLRRIHWRSSARHGELVVREYEPPGVQTLEIVVDPAPPTEAVADQIARIAASEAWDCILDGGRVSIGTLVSRDMWEILEWLARFPANEWSDARGRGETVVVTADANLLEPKALRNWLVGDVTVEEEIEFERVGTGWPL
jgi:uncharacterized protein (DUF58 family)